MNVRRFLQAGAVWGWPIKDDPLTEARDRYDVTGAPVIVESPWGRALSLDGTNDYVTLKDSEEFLLRFDSGAQDFSIAAWIRRGVTGVADFNIVNKLDGNNDGWRLLFASDDKLYGSVNGLSAVSTEAITDALWHNCVFTVDRSGDAFIYVDGVAGAASAIGGAVMATTNLVNIGSRGYDNTRKFNGDIAGIVIWDRVLTPAEALALATPGRSF